MCIVGVSIALVFVGCAISTAAPAGASSRNANYAIDVRLSPDAAQLTGRARIRWRNTASRPTRELRFLLYYNVKRPESPTRDGDAMRVTSIAIDGGSNVLGSTTLRPTDGGAGDERAVLVVPLDRIAQPGREITADVQWTAAVPRDRGDFFLLAHWFPQLGVFSEAGWICVAPRGEAVYSDFGEYEVRIDVPRGWQIAATGEPAASHSSDGSRRFVAEDVHDFAWAASRSWSERSARVARPDGTNVSVRVLLRPEHQSQDGHILASVSDALRAEDRWLAPYAGRQLTIADVPWHSTAGGEAFPQLLLLDTAWLQPARSTDIDVSLARLLARHYWLQTFAPDPASGWRLHEGFASFFAARLVDVLVAKRLESPSGAGFLVARFFDGFVPWLVRGVRINAIAAAADRTSRARHAVLTLERYLGWPTLEAAFDAYVDRFAFTHPAASDFFETVDRATGRDLDWFFDQAYDDSRTFDYAVGSASTDRGADGRYRSAVTVVRNGDAIFSGSSRPRVGSYQSGRGVETLFEFEDGSRSTESWDGRDRSTTYVFESASPLASVRVDPGGTIAVDENRTNNTWTRGSRAWTAATRWAASWMVWLEHTVVQYAFLA